MHLKYLVILVAFIVYNTPAKDVFLSNFSCGISRGFIPGTVWIIGCGEANSANGYSVLQLRQTTSGLEAQGSSDFILPSGIMGVHEQVFYSQFPENRRFILTPAGTAMIGQAFKASPDSGITESAGLVRILPALQDIDTFKILAGNIDPESPPEWEDLLQVSVHSIAVDQGGQIWTARGPWGVARSITSPLTWENNVAIPDSASTLVLNPKDGRWDTVEDLSDLDTTKSLSVWAIAIDSSKGTLWVGSNKGLWRGHRDSTKLNRIRLGTIDTLRITGIWMDDLAQKIVVESALRDTVRDTTRVNGKTQIKKNVKVISSLWTSWNQGNSFEKVNMPYDSLDVSVYAVAFLGNVGWAAVQGLESTDNGLIQIQGSTASKWPDSLTNNSREATSRFLWGMEAGVVDRDGSITGVTTFDLGTGKGLAVSTFGAGISVSADSGRTWRQILNQKSVKTGLKEVRMVPSVMRGYGTSLVAYRLSKSAKVTIEVFSYDMRKVRTIVRNEPRLADPVRSTNPREDIWDGRDDAGNPVVAGMYYVRVKDNKDHESWGKVLFLGGAQ